MKNFLYPSYDNNLKEGINLSTIIYEYIMHGIVMGSIYSLMALGVAMIYSILKFTNFAHGEFYILGGYAFYYLSVIFGVPLPLGILLSVAAVALIAMLLERTLLHEAVTGRIERPGDYGLLITYAFSLLIQNTLILVFGPFIKMPPPLLKEEVNIGPLVMQWNYIIVILLSWMTYIFLFLFFRKTTWGKRMYAVAQNDELIELLGLNAIRLKTTLFIIGASLAGFAGILLTPIFTLSPTGGWIAVVKGFIVMIMAGMGSIMGCIVSGYIVGITEMLCNYFLSPSYRDLYGFIVMIIFLLFRPQGLFGEVERLR